MFHRGISRAFGAACVAAALGVGCGGTTGSTATPGEPGPSLEQPAAPAPEEGADSQPAPAFSGPWLGAFEAGVDANEQLWLLPEQGSPEPLMLTNEDPVLLRARGTAGYPDQTGYISASIFDAEQGRVIVANRERSRTIVRWVDLASGRWNTLELAGNSTLRRTERGAVILSVEDGQLLVTAAVGAEFETVTRVSLPADSFPEDLTLLRYLNRGEERLLLEGVGEFERNAGAWQRVPSPLRSGAALAWAAPSPDGALLCAVSVDGSGWLVSADNALDVALSFPGDHCSFSPTGSLAAFTGRPGRNELHLADRNGAGVADFDLLYLQANRAGFAYGTDGRHLVRLDWQTLALETLPSPPGLCPTQQGEDSTVWHSVDVVGDVAIVEQVCRCIDCRYSAVYLQQLSSPTAEPEPLLGRTEWQILQIGRLADGSALIAGSWHTSASEFTGGDILRRVFADGTVADVGPFSGVPTPLHAPVSGWR